MKNAWKDAINICVRRDVRVWAYVFGAALWLSMAAIWYRFIMAYVRPAVVATIVDGRIVIGVEEKGVCATMAVVAVVSFHLTSSAICALSALVRPKRVAGWIEALSANGKNDATGAIDGNYEFFMRAKPQKRAVERCAARRKMRGRE